MIMKWIKKFKLFESLENKIDLNELDDVMIDFKQMNLEWDVKVGFSIVIDWEKFNKDNLIVLPSKHIDRYIRNRTSDSLTIEFDYNTDSFEYNISDLEDAYDMLQDYLFETYDLIPNYIYINFHWNYIYFQNFNQLKYYKNNLHDKLISDAQKYLNLGGIGSTNPNIFKAHKVIFGFYEDPDAPFRGPEF
jgi:uncharacterized protein Usg